MEPSMDNYSNYTHYENPPESTEEELDSAFDKSVDSQLEANQADTERFEDAGNNPIGELDNIPEPDEGIDK